MVEMLSSISAQIYFPKNKALQYLLILEHLNSVVPSHTTVGGTASNKNDLSLASLGLQDGSSTKGTGASQTRLVSEGKGSSLSGENRGKHDGGQL
jgi:hypothetical protein